MEVAVDQKYDLGRGSTIVVVIVVVIFGRLLLLLLWLYCWLIVCSTVGGSGTGWKI